MFVVHTLETHFFPIYCNSVIASTSRSLPVVLWLTFCMNSCSLSCTLHKPPVAVYNVILNYLLSYVLERNLSPCRQVSLYPSLEKPHVTLTSASLETKWTLFVLAVGVTAVIGLLELVCTRKETSVNYLKTTVYTYSASTAVSFSVDRSRQVSWYSWKEQSSRKNSRISSEH